MLNRTAAHLLLVLGLLGHGPAVGHDFWLQPREYWLAPGVTTPITLQVGHGPYRQRSPIRSDRITRFAAVSPQGAVLDLRTRLHLGDPLDDGSVVFPERGTYVVVLETDNRAQSHLPTIRFNDYLHVEGLTPALEERERLHRMDRDGSEIYSRHAKTLIQVSAGEMDARSVTQPLGLPLEIVPEVNPYAEPKPNALPIRVFYEGRTLAGALVKLTELEHDDTPFETHRTDAAGCATFTLPREGAWLLNVIWTRALPKTSETDFETVFSSLSFGFPTRRP